ncbi:hypothetical protein [Burkholderia cenocepacia]|uniref:hypothetical protein n=1 Tax=Burkholderia cenocepacia TaxID=95486 RepID=UPI0012B2793D|nr:hypothetical protein [Burkholderia cenocepacia]
MFAATAAGESPSPPHEATATHSASSAVPNPQFLDIACLRFVLESSHWFELLIFQSGIFS